MNIIFNFIALAFCFTYVGTQVPDCSLAEDGDQFPDQSSCSIFYLCILGEPLLKYCLHGLHFDSSTNNCVLPAEIPSGKCSLKEICLNHDDGYKFAHKDCAKFYLCHQHNPVLTECPPLLYFDSTDSTCKPADQISGPCNVPVDICAKYDDGYMLPHPDKTKFYLCFEKKARIIDCEPGLIFDQEKQFCTKPGLPKHYLYSCNGRKLYE